MPPVKMIVRCYARLDEQKQWTAVCVDFSLAAQADTFEEAKQKLQDQVRDYVADAFGQDRAHARKLLTQRKAPFSQLLTYYRIKLECMIRKCDDSPSEKHPAALFCPPLPLQPA